jgi:SNF2 family DNA or RNA helicase
MEAHIESNGEISRVSFSSPPPSYVVSQLAVWGFRAGEDGLNRFTSSSKPKEILPKVEKYLSGKNFVTTSNSYTKNVIDSKNLCRLKLLEAIKNGKEFKDEGEICEEAQEFARYTATLGRPLKDHQIKAGIHYITVGNGANFSVPGSGKTTVALSIWGYLRSKKRCGPLAVIGPSSSFGPWQKEFEKVFLKKPDTVLLGGISSSVRRKAYQNCFDPELILINYQTIFRDIENYREYLKSLKTPAFLVVDEAHYIKQQGGVWAQAIMSIAQLTESRYILSGTPFPRSHTDAFNLFDFLWPESPPICERTKQEIINLESKKNLQGASEILKSRIFPLFYRVRKKDLNLSEQNFTPPTLLEMNPEEKFIYNSIIGKIEAKNQEEFGRDFDTLDSLRKGRITRLRQAASYPPLLMTALPEYEENIVEGSLADRIASYSKKETPKKMEHLLKQITDLTIRGEKVVVWANFIGCLEKIVEKLSDLGINTRLITGSTPIAKSNQINEDSREKYIEEFLHGGVMVLVGNPAACAESISLHTHCSTAIYYDMSYNCAQFLQSLDRIHRVGGSETKISHYHFLQSNNTIDQDIWQNISRKRAALENLLDDDCPIIGMDLEMEDSGELEAYERLFG